MTKLRLPKSLLDLPEKDREDIIAVLLQASKLPKSKKLHRREDGDEHNMWERNVENLLADAEDDFYRELIMLEARNMGALIAALHLTIDGFEKALETEFHAFEDELMKAKDSGRNRMSKLIQDMAKKSRAKIAAFEEWVRDGKAWKQQQLKDIDRLLRKDLPNYAKKAEDFMIRAGFIGKIRNQAEQDGFDVLGAIVDRYPDTINSARKTGVTLTVRQKEKEEQATRKKATVAPLTEAEAEAVLHGTQHAGDKLTEISEKHRAAIRQTVIQAKRERWTADQLASKLFDTFSDHNRDWRRVAITELAFVTNDAYISGVDEGGTVIGMGAVNACKHCKKYVIGKTFAVTHNPPEKDTYHGDMKQIWAGKSNYGRRVAEYRPAIPMHPHCRCRWHRISRFYKLGDEGALELKSTAELIQEERAKRGLEPDPSLMKENKPLSQEELAAKAEAVLHKLNRGG